MTDYIPAPQRRHLRLRIPGLRQIIGIAILVGMIWGLYWLIFHSGLMDPVLHKVQPIYNEAVAMINDPLGIDWGDKLLSAAMLIVPHIGILAFILDSDQR